MIASVKYIIRTDVLSQQIHLCGSEKENNNSIPRKREMLGVQAHLQENLNLLLWWAPMDKKGTMFTKHAP